MIAARLWKKSHCVGCIACIVIPRQDDSIVTQPRETRDGGTPSTLTIVSAGWEDIFIVML